MTKEMKRPTSHISRNSIKPALSKAVEFYTDNNRQAYECIRERDEYIDYLEYELKQKDEHILKVENENSFMRDERTTFDSNGMAVEPKIPQQALPVVPDYVGNVVMKINLEYLFTGYTNGINEKAKNWLERHKGVKSLGYYVCQLRFQGFIIEKPQLFKIIFPNSTAVLQKDGELNSFADTAYKRYLIKNAMTEQEIKSIDERYWQFAVPVEEEK